MQKHRSILTLGPVRFLTLLLSTVISLGYALSLSASPLIMRQLDVGEGNAMLISHGGYSALIDAGNPVGSTNLVQRIKSLTGDSLSAVIISHPHQDHLGGVFDVLASFKIGNYTTTGRQFRRLVNLTGGTGSPLDRGLSLISRYGQLTPYTSAK